MWRGQVNVMRAGLGFALTLALVGCGGGEQSPRQTAQIDVEPVVSTQAGVLRGLREDGVYKFKGVHYGASTAGAGRFRPPQPVAAWEGERDATSFGPICPQTGVVATGADETYMVGPIPQLPQSEDCLVLNVWTPALSGQRPVMLWLHGRGFREGAGSEGWYNGTDLARNQDLVVITINHRLNVFGYLQLDEIGGETFTGSGVVGMLDAVQALTWVRDNIAAFGGDPNNVTIFGESGGGAKVSTLLAMPDAEGLFHKAIIQSGAGLRGMLPERGTANARLLLAELGLAEDALDELQALPFATISEAVTKVERAQAPGAMFAGQGFGFSPVIGSRYLPAHPFDPQASPHARNVPIMIGTTLHEMTLLSIADPRRGALTEEEMLGRLQMAVGADNAARLLEIYRLDMPDATPWDLWIAFQSDLAFRIPSIRLAERQVQAGGAPVYMYLFTWESDVGDPPMKSAHALEIPFIFGTADIVPLTGSGEGQAELTAQLQGAWGAFARNGDPSHAGLPNWAPYVLEHADVNAARFTYVLDVPPWPANDPLGVSRETWESVPLFRR